MCSFEYSQVTAELCITSNQGNYYPEANILFLLTILSSNHVSGIGVLKGVLEFGNILHVMQHLYINIIRYVKVIVTST